MSDPREALTRLLGEHEVETYHGGWSCRCGVNGTVDYIDHLVGLIDATCLVVPRSDIVGTEYGWRRNPSDRNIGPRDDRAAAVFTAQKRGGEAVDPNAVRNEYPMLDDRDLIAGTDSAIEGIVREAMSAGAVYFMDKVAAGEINPQGSMGDAFGGFPGEFIKIRASLVADAIAALEAAQRPPLGYVALAKRPESVKITGPVWSDEAKAREATARMSGDAERHPAFWRGAEFVTAAVRVVRP